MRHGIAPEVIVTRLRKMPKAFFDVSSVVVMLKFQRSVLCDG